jgi:hypothetical protein
MKKNIFLLIVILLVAFNFNLNATTIIIISNKNWSSISPAPTSADVVIVGKGAILTVDAATTNGVCAGIQLGVSSPVSSIGNGTLTFSSGSQITVVGDATLGETSLNYTGSLNMTLGGTLKIGGAFTAPKIGTYTPGLGTIEYNGSTQQTILSTASIVNNYKYLKINNPAGVILGGAVTVAGTLNMASGNITTGSNILTLGTSTINLGTFLYTSGLIITGSTGGFTRWFMNASISNRVFPVGTSTTNNSITMSFTGAPSAGGTLTARFIPSDPGTNSLTPVNDGGYTVDAYSPVGYWQFDAGNGLTGGTYSLSLSGQGFNSSGVEITNYAHLRILKRPGQGFNWIADGLHINATGSNNDPTIKRGNLSGFSQFAMGGSVTDGNPLIGSLPVELSLFSFSVSSNNVHLRWTTSSEINNKGFEIYRKTINSDWIKIGYIEGSGNSSSPKTYKYDDNSFISGSYYYRLKQMDFNGNFKYFQLSSLVVIGIPLKINVEQNYPNPFNPITKIDYEIPGDIKVSLQVYDISGREIAKLVDEKQRAGFYSVDFNGQNLSSGTYFYRLSAGNSVVTKRMILIK